MLNEILKLALSQGIFAALFVYMLYWVLRENAKRETKYQNLIESLSENFSDLSGKIDRIEGKIDNIRGNK